MEKLYYYDVTDWRLAIGFDKEHWDVEEIQALDAFGRWVGDEIEIVGSIKRIEGIPEIDIEEIKEIESR